jgi:hypothetical protein
MLQMISNNSAICRLIGKIGFFREKNIFSNNIWGKMMRGQAIQATTIAMFFLKECKRIAIKNTVNFICWRARFQNTAIKSTD